MSALSDAGILLGMTAGWLIGVAPTHRIRVARRPMTSALLAVTGLVLAIPCAAGLGPTAETLLALRVSEWPLVSVQRLQLLWIWGLAVLAVAAVLARRGVEREELVPTAG